MVVSMYPFYRSHSSTKSVANLYGGAKVLPISELTQLWIFFRPTSQY